MLSVVIASLALFFPKSSEAEMTCYSDEFGNTQCYGSGDDSGYNMNVTEDSFGNTNIYDNQGGSMNCITDDFGNTSCY